jgi:signal transduction histidine kinase/DNA-binding response OmpR family regulator
MTNQAQMVTVTKGVVLIVDDLPDNLRLLSTMLLRSGYEVRRAVNGSTALMGAQAAPPDLVLLDIRMPDINGYEVCRRLKAAEKTREVPVIFLSASDEVLDKVQAFEAGGVDYITKPFHVQEVLARVENQMTIRRQQAQLRREIHERSQVETALRQQIEREQLTGAIAQRMRQSLNLEEILQTTAAEVRQFLSVDRVVVYQVNTDRSAYVIAETSTQPLQPLQEKKFVPEVFAPEEYQAYTQGKIQIYGDTQAVEIPPGRAEFLQQLEVRSVMVVPILQATNLWGLMVLHQCHNPRTWVPFEIDLMQQLSTQVSIAIRQAELYQQVQRLNTDLEKQVQERTAQLQIAYEFEATLKRITDKVRDSLDEVHIVQTAVQELAIAVGAISCNAALYNLEARTSTVCYEYTLLEHSFQGHVSQMEAYPEIYNQLLQQQPFQFCSIAPNPLRGHVAMLAYPMIDDQGVLGDVWLINPMHRAFSEQDIRLVQQVANQCAIALRQSRLYHAAQAQVKELERLHQLKDDFLSTVSHELRTPMANIKMSAQMLEICLGQTDILTRHKDVERYLQILSDACQQEINLINNLLDLSRLDAESDPLVLCNIALHTWLTHIAEPFYERIRNQQQEFRLQIPDELPCLTTDLLYLERIVTELLNNACKYTPSGETITLSASVVPANPLKKNAHSQQLNSTPFLDDEPGMQAALLLENVPDGARLQFAISNTGVEIPPEEQERIFDKFYRIPNKDPWKHGGTGLGLALVRKLVERLGGTIAVFSGAGQTTFILELGLDEV